jgi:hypothetical protein
MTFAIHPFTRTIPALQASLMETARFGTNLSFACGMSNGGSYEKPTFNVRPTGISERQKLGRLKTGSFRESNLG